MDYQQHKIDDLHFTIACILKQIGGYITISKETMFSCKYDNEITLTEHSDGSKTIILVQKEMIN